MKDISSSLRAALRRLKLGPILETLPERLLLAGQKKLSHMDFLELIISDEIARREQRSTLNRIRRTRVDPALIYERWDDSAKVSYDRSLWEELSTLRFVEKKHDVLILGPVGVGKTFLANALGNIACRRGLSVFCERTEKVLKDLKAARLDNTHERELRQLLSVDLLILDDFGLDTLDETESQDLYEIMLERNHRRSMIMTSLRDPQEWLATFSDPMRAQSAVDRIRNSAYELVLEGESYRKRQKPSWGTRGRTEDNRRGEFVDS
jgi:DNA replication protein DnaC